MDHSSFLIDITDGLLVGFIQAGIFYTLVFWRFRTKNNLKFKDLHFATGFIFTTLILGIYSVIFSKIEYPYKEIMDALNMVLIPLIVSFTVIRIVENKKLSWIANLYSRLRKLIIDRCGLINSIKFKTLFFKGRIPILVVGSGLVIFLSYFILSNYAGNIFAKSPRNVYDMSINNVVSIMSLDAANKLVTFGSGFVVGENDIIVTSYHVIKGAASIVVKRGNNKPIDVEGATLLDEENDVALLKINNSDSKGQPLKTGNPHELKIGDKVYAIGNPMGFEFSLSEGIVAGLRDISSSKGTHRIIQFTAPVSPGSSGGPLLNDKGKVIGIITLASRSEAQNINFAIPIDLVDVALEEKNITYFFPPIDSDWTPVVDKFDNCGNYFSHKTLIYDDKGKVRIWHKRDCSESNVYPLDILHYELFEIDCKNQRYRSIAYFMIENGHQAESEISFDEKWEKYVDEDLDDICRYYHSK